MRLTVKAIDDELKLLGHDAQLMEGDGYFYFTSGETTNWLDRTVKVPTLSSLTLEQWVEEFKKLKSLNHELFGAEAKPKEGSPTQAGRKQAKKK